MAYRRIGSIILLVAFMALTLLAAQARAQGPHTVIPVIRCIDVDLAELTFTTHFNYDNTGNTILLQIGTFNKFVPAPEFRGQPLLFSAGGINPANEFAIPMPIGDTISWALGTSIVTTSLNLPLCNGAEILEDTDGDGEVDPTEKCPSTVSLVEVDDSGCSLAQFCASKTIDGDRVCLRSDWQNDEPIMRSSNRDCEWDYSSTQCMPVLTIATGVLPQPVLNTAYNEQPSPLGEGVSLLAAGGVTPYAWSVTAGALPFGLDLDFDGFLSGEPTVSGSYTFTVTVTDTTGGTDSREYVLDVVP